MSAVPLWACIKADDLSEFRRLLQSCECDPNGSWLPNVPDASLLWKLALSGRAEAFAILLDHPKTDILRRLGDDGTLLRHLLRTGSSLLGSFVEAVVARGAMEALLLSDVDCYGNTLLHTAVASGQAGVLRACLDATSSAPSLQMLLGRRNAWGQTALDLAIGTRRSDCEKVLRRRQCESARGLAGELDSGSESDTHGERHDGRHAIDGRAFEREDHPVVGVQ